MSTPAIEAASDAFDCDTTATYEAQILARTPDTTDTGTRTFTQVIIGEND